MIKPMGVLLVLALVLTLLPCLILALWGLVHYTRVRARKTAVVLGIIVVAIAVFSVSALYVVAPKGGRTIAKLDLPDGRAFVVRHYRYGWFEYPKVRFYARNANGDWTSFSVISELIDPGATSLVLDAAAQEIQLTGAGWFRIEHNEFVNVDGSRGTVWQLPPGIDPGEEDINSGAHSSS